MIDKFTLNIYLVICAIEYHPSKKDASKFLVIKNNDNYIFPSQFLKKQETTRDVATKLLTEYTGITLDWAVLYPFGIVDNVDPNKETVEVLYGVFIPEITRIRHAESSWQTYQTLNGEGISEITKKLAYESIWRQV